MNKKRSLSFLTYVQQANSTAMIFQKKNYQSQLLQAPNI